MSKVESEANALSSNVKVILEFLNLVEILHLAIPSITPTE